VLLVQESDPARGAAAPAAAAPPAAATTEPRVRTLVATSTAVLATLLTAGTMVTAAGPHAGDSDTPRLGLGVPLMAHIHGALLFCYLGLLVLLGLALRRSPADRAKRRYLLLLAAVVAQGVLGVVQYRLGVPEILVSLHVLGACLVTAAAAALWTATHPATP
jgi:cytochrome c oxidase assembly protein subunit 15